MILCKKIKIAGKYKKNKSKKEANHIQYKNLTKYKGRQREKDRKITIKLTENNKTVIVNPFYQ